MAAPPPVQIHATAVVDAGATLGAGTKVWHFAHVCTGARVGRQCVLGQNVYVGPGVTLGDGCKVQNNVSVYSGVTVGRNVFLGPSCTFTNDKYPRAHGAWHVTPTVVEDEASVGANATIVCGVTLGRGCLVGAGAVVTRDVAPGTTVVGNPARVLK